MKLAGIASMAMALVITTGAFGYAYDNAADAAYNSGWSTGTNGGTGFGPWNLNPYGWPLGSSYMATHSTVDIKTAGRAWGYAGSSDTYSYAGIDGTRDLLSPMAAGDTFSMDIDNGVQAPVAFSYNDGGFGMALQDSTGAELVGLYAFSSVPGFYQAVDASGAINPVMPVITTGFHLSITLTSASTYSMTLTPIGGSPVVRTGTMKSGGPVSRIRLWQYNLENGPDGVNDTYFNNMQAVPEPSTMLALAAGAGFVLRRRRKA